MRPLSGRGRAVNLVCRFCLAVSALICTLTNQLGAQSALTRSTLDGVFTVQQARRGESSFYAQCVDCHDIAEFSGPEAVFQKERGNSIWPIFDFMWSEMPEDRPAWLEPNEYADILAFLLSEFGMPAGNAELEPDPDTLRSVRLVYPDGG
jgi:hypothetical protein